ncbi:Di-copper centre-containing protein, partial [Dothidotthia symphoricarpi CBS 119687]
MANFSKPQNMMTAVFAFLALLQFTTAFQHGAAHHSHPRSASVDDVIKAQMDVVSEALDKRQTSGYTAITGVKTGATAPRLEIRKLMQNADQWNLYLLGMERFMAKDKSERLSYYQVVGIHGRPYVTWGNFPTPLLNQAGFCPHAQSLFGSWHRPYLALFEQAWYASVLEVVATFPSSTRSRWSTAAATLRMPYWDWAQEPASGQPVVPTSIRDATVSVTKPSGKVTINNPLYSYSWGSSLPTEMGGGPWDSWPATLRRPVANPTRNNNNEMNARFTSIRVSLRDRVFALFSSKASWGTVSTSQIGARTDLSGNGVDSYESVHDAVHTTAGGESGGHMYYLDLSSFDPIFWLHHTNIDRLLAMHQIVVPNTWVANGNINRGMAQWNQGEAKNAYTPLKPFTKDTAGNYFTSNDIKDTRVLGYYYPETSGNSYSQVASAVTSLYGAGSRTLSKRDESDTDPATGQYLGRPFEEGDYHTVLSVTADKFAMDGSYTVHCFIRDDATNSTSTNSTGSSNSTGLYPLTNTTLSVPSVNYNTTLQYEAASGDSEADYNPSTDMTQDANYVGAYSVLGGSMAGKGEPVMTEGNLPLTSCLQGKQKDGKLASLKPEHVEPYLAKNLYYVVIGPNGEIDAASVPNLHLAVKCNKVVPASSSGELPDLSAPFVKLPNATKNLPAGEPFTYTPQANDIAPPAGDSSYEE